MTSSGSDPVLSTRDTVQSVHRLLFGKKKTAMGSCHEIAVEHKSLPDPDSDDIDIVSQRVFKLHRCPSDVHTKRQFQRPDNCLAESFGDVVRQLMLLCGDPFADCLADSDDLRTSNT